MKNAFLFFFLLITGLTSCDDGRGEAPMITVDSIYVNGEPVNTDLYRPIPEKSSIEVFTTLDAQEGTTLLSFNVETICSEEGKGEECIIPEIEYVKEHVSDAGFNDTSVLRFKDGIVKSKAVVRAQLSSSTDDYLLFKLYLNTDDAGTKEELTFFISEEDDD